MKFKELESKVLKWQYDKGIIQAGNRVKQALKTLEETGELLEEIADDNIEGIIDAIGDITVTLIGQCEINGIKFMDCLESQTDEEIIEDRGRYEQALITLGLVKILLTEIANDNTTGIIESIGDIAATLIKQCEINGIEFLDCLESAYNEIANRTGKIVNGTFVKDSK